MHCGRTRAALLAVALAMPLVALAPCGAGGAPQPDYQAKLEQYLQARRAFDAQAAAYWQAIADKRRARFAKRRGGEPVGLDDYVLAQPPVYAGPPRPVDPSAPDQPPPRPPYIPVVADFLAAAAEQFGFVPDRPESEAAFKRAYARAAAAAGLTREQVVGIYAFETGGIGTYDAQAGLTHPRPGARAISPALGYNQLLSTNSIGLLAEHGNRFLKRMQRDAEALGSDARQQMAAKLEAVRRMMAFTRSVPNRWSEHDHLAKNTRGGWGVHAAVLDRDLGPLLQVQKLIDSVAFARAKGRKAPLTAAELEMLNLTGDGNGFDMVVMPQELRRQVPTSNFFQQAGYERNPIARRSGTVAGLFAAIETKMQQAAQLPGARELAAAF
jgi:hypothetical protein